MSIAKTSCRTCKHFNEGMINGQLYYICTLKVLRMNSRIANLDRSNWEHYSGKFNNPNACLEYEKDYAREFWKS